MTVCVQVLPDMNRTTDTYSRLVGILKIILPLAALGLMSTVFLFARAPSPDSAIPYAEIEEIAQEPRLAGAQMSGVSEDGSHIALAARTAWPRGDLLAAEALSATVTSPSGTVIDIRSGAGEINNTDRTARLTGLTRLETTNGFSMETMGVEADLDSGRIASDGALEVQAPFGSLTAGQLIIETPENATGQVMLFQNGVRLVYMPQQ